MATRWYDSDTDGQNVEQYYSCHDGNSNFTAVVDTSGDAVERYPYTPYGQFVVLDADFSEDAGNVSDIANPYTFTGRRFDEETRLYQ